MGGTIIFRCLEDMMRGVAQGSWCCEIWKAALGFSIDSIPRKFRVFVGLCWGWKRCPGCLTMSAKSC